MSVPKILFFFFFLKNIYESFPTVLPLLRTHTPPTHPLSTPTHPDETAETSLDVSAYEALHSRALETLQAMTEDMHQKQEALNGLLHSSDEYEEMRQNYEKKIEDMEKDIGKLKV
jgi:hypothetical protein